MSSSISVLSSSFATARRERTRRVEHFWPVVWRPRTSHACDRSPYTPVDALKQAKDSIEVRTVGLWAGRRSHDDFTSRLLLPPPFCLFAELKSLMTCIHSANSKIATNPSSGDTHDEKAPRDTIEDPRSRVKQLHYLESIPFIIFTHASTLPNWRSASRG